MRVAWSSASVFNLRSANLAGFVPPEEQEKKYAAAKRPGFWGIFGYEKRIVIKILYSSKRSQTGMGKASGAQAFLWPFPKAAREVIQRGCSWP